MKSNVDRGDIVRIGVSNNPFQESLKQQQVALIGFMILIFLILYFGINHFLQWYSTDIIQSVLILFIIPFLILIMQVILSLERSIIYENGVTHPRSYLSDKILKKSYAPFDKIKTIVYDFDRENNDVEYIFLLGEKHKSLIPAFWKSQYKDTDHKFLHDLYTKLKLVCHDVQWIEIAPDKIDDWYMKQLKNKK